MNDIEFEKELTEALKEYVKDTEKNQTAVPPVKFSKGHEKRMRKIFKAVENGTFEDFENQEDNEAEKVLDTKRVYVKYAKVAVFILLGLVASIAIAPRMSAWRKEELDLYGNQIDRYAWILNNDTNEIHEASNENLEEYLNKFESFPEDFEITAVIKTPIYVYIQFQNAHEEIIELKVMDNLNGAVNMENINYQTFYVDEMEIMCFERANENIMIWTYGDNQYRLYSKKNAIDKAKIIIKNIKYKEFEKFF